MPENRKHLVIYFLVRLPGLIYFLVRKLVANIQGVRGYDWLLDLVRDILPSL